MKTIFLIFTKCTFPRTRSAMFFTFLFLINFFCVSEVHSQSTREFKTSTDTLVVYSDVPGLTPSDKYTIRVRSAASNNQWVDVFAHYTYNRAAELGGVSVPKTDGTTLQTTVYNYAKHTSAWSHTYGNIEMSKNSPVEVEIAAKNGFKIINRDFFKATVHPAQKASVATLVDGKIYFTVSNPCQLVIDINGQMDDYNAAINGGTGSPVHAISIFANPVIKKPSLINSRVYYVEPGTTLATLKDVNPASYDTLYFKPGVHDLGQDIKMYPGKVIYLSGDALIYGNMNNKGVPAGSFSKNGENIRVYGYGTLSGAKIVHEDYVTPPYTVSSKGLEIENGLNWRVSGISIVDPANHSVYTIGGANGLFSYTKVISWRANGDGIGGYEPVVDCFIRTQDDCSYVKGYKARCTFWKDANAALFHMANITENMTTPLIIEDCDIIYARLRDPVGTNGGGFQQRGEGAAGQRNVNVIFRNIRVHDRRVNMPIISLVSYSGGSETSPTVVGSSYKGILFQNISIAGMASGNKQRILGCAAAPWYGGLIFDNLTIGGTKVTLANHLTYFNTNQFVKYLLFAMPQDVTLTTIADPNKGTISRNPDQATYLETSTVKLTAVGKSGYVFSNWSGDITSTTNPIDVVVDKNMTITANFSDPDFTKPLIIVAPGSGSFTVPFGAQSVTVQVWGGGGAGGSASNNEVASQTRGGGGAGGGYAGVTTAVSAGQVLSYTLGAGGVAAPVGFANNSVNVVQNGGFSRVSLDSQIIAQALGGPGGRNIAGTTTTVQSGSGGFAPSTGNIGGVVYYGGSGGTANSTGTGAGGGSAGAGGNGGSANAPTAGVGGLNGGADGGAGINSTNVGNPGKVPGAGGSGAAVRVSSNTTMKGGDGSDGRLVLIFTFAPLSTVEMESNKMIEIYPNPVSDKLFFNSKDKEISKVRLVDLTGKIVYSAVVKSQNGSIDLFGLPKGLYVLKLQTDSDTVTKKISIK